jgi:Flp pilus assembly protein TadD
MIFPDDLAIGKPKRVRLPFVLALLLAGSVLAGCETASEEMVLEEQQDLSLTSIVHVEDADPDTIILAERALADERFEDAERLIERVLYTYPDDTRGHLIAAELRLAQGNAPAAMPMFAQLLVDPLHAAEAKQGYGITLLLIGDEDLAASHLQEAVEKDPSLWRAWNALGAYYDSREDWTAASISYKNALDIEPKQAYVQNNYGFSLFMQDRLDEAISALQKAFRLDPNSELIKTNLRLAYARKGQYVRALSGAQENEKARNLNNVGYIALLRGDYNEAESYFLRAMEADARFNEVAWQNLNYLKSLRALDATTKQVQVN